MKQRDEQENLGNLTLIWLDQNSNSSEENLVNQEKIRARLFFLLTFETIDELKVYLNRCVESSQMQLHVLIVSGRMAEKTIELIDEHRFDFVRSIFIFCFDKNKYSRLMEKSSRVRSVETKLDRLIEQIDRDNQSISSTIFSSLWIERNSNRLTEELLAVRWTKLDRRALLDRTLDSLGLGRSVELQEFEHFYEQNKSMEFYFEHRWLERLLVGSIERDRFDLFFLLRFVGDDIYANEDRFRVGSTTTDLFFRFQLIEREKAELVPTWLNKTIRFDRIFSVVSDDDGQRRKRFDSTFDERQSDASRFRSVLFEIDDRTRSVKQIGETKFFSQFDSFLVESIVEENRKLVVRLLSLGKVKFNRQRIRTSFELAEFLRRTNEFSRCEQIYRLLLENKIDRNSCFLCYRGLARLARDRLDYSSSLHFYEKSFEFRLTEELSSLLNEMAMINDDLQFYQRSIDLYVESFRRSKTRREKLIVLNNLAIVFVKINDLDRARFCFANCSRLIECSELISSPSAKQVRENSLIFLSSFDGIVSQ